MKLKIDGCSEVFHPDFDPGVIATQELTFPTADKDSDNDWMFLKAFWEHEEEFIKKHVKVIWEEIE